MKYYLIEGTKKGRADVSYPDSSWGYGEVCAYDSLINLIDILNLIIGPKPEYRIDEWYTTLTEYYEAYKDSDEKISILVEYNNAQEKADAEQQVVRLWNLGKVVRTEIGE